MATTVQVPVQKKSSVQRRHYALAFLAAFVVIVMRRPDAIFHAQFYAEDGRIFYAQAHNLGWFHAIFIPYQGYFHLFPRLAAGVAIMFPLALAPLVQNTLAVCAETLPVALLVSPVCERWGSMKFRCVLAVLYLTVPNCGQIIGSITESQWILGLVAFLIITGEESAPLLGLLAPCCLTGPFCIFLLPFAAWRARERKAMFCIVAASALIQGAAIALTPRAKVPLGASVAGFLQILGAQVYAGALLGASVIAIEPAIVLAILGTVFLALVKGKQIRALQLLALIVFVASIARPTIRSHDQAWQTMATWAGSRYWFIPCLAVVWSLAYAFRSKMQAPAVLLSVILTMGVLHDFCQPSRSDFRFAASVERYEAAPMNAKVVIPQAPAGWTAVLVKR